MCGRGEQTTANHPQLERGHDQTVSEYPQKQTAAEAFDDLRQAVDELIAAIAEEVDRIGTKKVLAYLFAIWLVMAMVCIYFDL